VLSSFGQFEGNGTKSMRFRVRVAKNSRLFCSVIMFLCHGNRIFQRLLAIEEDSQMCLHLGNVIRWSVDCL
jgi:hypothetical protein